MDYIENYLAKLPQLRGGMFANAHLPATTNRLGWTREWVRGRPAG